MYSESPVLSFFHQNKAAFSVFFYTFSRVVLDLFRKLERALQRNNPVENRFARLAVAAVHAEVSIADELKALKCFCLFQTRL